MSPLISNDGLKSLSDLTKLRSLTIDARKVSDDGLPHIAGLALRELRISASLTDRGLEHLLSRRHLPWSRGELAERLLLVCVPPAKDNLVYILMESTSSDFEEQPLCDVLDYLSQRHAISISTREDLVEAGIEASWARLEVRHDDNGSRNRTAAETSGRESQFAEAPRRLAEMHGDRRLVMIARFLRSRERISFTNPC